MQRLHLLCYLEDDSVTEEKKRVKSLSKTEKEKAENSKINDGKKVKGEGKFSNDHILKIKVFLFQIAKLAFFWEKLPGF